MSNTWLIRERTQVSTNVLACVLGVLVVKGQGYRCKGHGQAPTCLLVSCASMWCQKERNKDTGEHISACPCPGCPHGVEGTGLETYRTWVSTSVLTHVLGIQR